MGVQILVDGRDTGVAEGLVHKGKQKGQQVWFTKLTPRLFLAPLSDPLFSSGSLPGGSVGAKARKLWLFDPRPTE